MSNPSQKLPTPPETQEETQRHQQREAEILDEWIKRRRDGNPMTDDEIDAAARQLPEHWRSRLKDDIDMTRQLQGLTGGRPPRATGPATADDADTPTVVIAPNPQLSVIDPGARFNKK